MAKKKLKCPKCDRTFNMPGHLARHLSATHKRKKKKTTKKRTKVASTTRKKRGRRVKQPARRRVGRPKGVASRFGLKRLSLEQLGSIIGAARREARRRIAALRQALSP
ncbi:MAG: hypothetical protein ACE5EQ_08765 [Phycisphaerae bacterium]